MNKEVEKSIAFAALSRPTKRIYQIICEEIARSGTGSAPLRATDLMERINSNSTAAVAAAVRELRGLGFITTTEGARCINVFALADDWRSITDPVEAKRIAAEAKAAKQRKPLTRPHVRTKRKPEVPVVDTEEPEEPPRVRSISLPVLAWPMNPNAGL